MASAAKRNRSRWQAAQLCAAAVEQKYDVQNVQLVCTWRFGAGFNDTCYIDKTSLYEQSLDGQANNIEDQTHDSWFISTGAHRCSYKPNASGFFLNMSCRRGVQPLFSYGQHQEVH